MKNHITMLIMALSLISVSASAQSQLEVEAPSSEVAKFKSTTGVTTTIALENDGDLPNGGAINNRRGYLETRANNVILGPSSNNTGGDIILKLPATSLGKIMLATNTTNHVVMTSNGKLALSKSLELGDEPSGASPTAGTIRWDGTDFQGYDGNNWKSLTQSENLNSVGETVTDIDGNVYKTVKIDDQVWMRENLKVTHYQDGTAILEEPYEIWGENKEVWGWYGNDYSNDQLYGKLYSLGVVISSKGVCPAGWKVPAESDFQTLATYLGGDSFAGGKMKSIGDFSSNSGVWDAPNTDATNESGFTGLPGGRRFADIIFEGKNSSGWWWTTSQDFFRRVVKLQNTNQTLYFTNTFDDGGYSIRCLKI